MPLDGHLSGGIISRVQKVQWKVAFLMNVRRPNILDKGVLFGDQKVRLDPHKRSHFPTPIMLSERPGQLSSGENFMNISCHRFWVGACRVSSALERLSSHGPIRERGRQTNC